jgi:hypothetical protein
MPDYASEESDRLQTIIREILTGLGTGQGSSMEGSKDDDGGPATEIHLPTSLNMN